MRSVAYDSVADKGNIETSKLTELMEKEVKAAEAKAGEVRSESVAARAMQSMQNLKGIVAELKKHGMDAAKQLLTHTSGAAFVGDQAMQKAIAVAAAASVVGAGAAAGIKFNPVEIASKDKEPEKDIGKPEQKAEDAAKGAKEAGTSGGKDEKQGEKQASNTGAKPKDKEHAKG